MKTKAIENHLFAPDGWKIVLPAVILLGLAARVMTYRLDPLLSRDGLFYLNCAIHWLSPNSDDTIAVAPLLTALGEIGNRFGCKVEQLLIGVNIAAGTLLIGIVFLIADRVSGSKNWALAAALLTATNPTLIQLSCELQRENLYLLFFGFSCLLLLAAPERKYAPGWLFLCGAVLALAVLGRLEAIEMAPFLLLYGIAAVRLRALPARTMWRSYSVLIAGLLAMLTCWLSLRQDDFLPYYRHAAGKVQHYSRKALDWRS